MEVHDFYFDNNTPIYIQISKLFQSKVFIGDLMPGDVIPSRRELASILKVNLNTVQKSYSYMEDIGLIKTEKNKHSIITYNKEIIESLKNEFLKEPLYKFIITMKSVNISKERVLELIDKEYDKVECENNTSKKESESEKNDKIEECDKKIQKKELSR